MVRIALVVLLVFTGAYARAQAPSDSCQAQVPRALGDALTRAFPRYRTPLETDNAPEDIQFHRAHRGSGCLGVGSADFTGEGKKDYLIGLTALKGSAGLAVIALPKKGGWHFQRVQSWTEDARYRQYVEVVPPGRYERAVAETAPLGPGEKQSMNCPNWGALVGTLEATGIVYCYIGREWLHVWTSR